jgi:hypothetical protein
MQSFTGHSTLTMDYKYLVKFLRPHLGRLIVLTEPDHKF